MHEFKIWDQARDGATMAIRVVDVDALENFANSCTMPDIDRNWNSLRDYLDAASIAIHEPAPYGREVDVIWGGDGLGVPQWSVCQDRRLRVIYSGRPSVTGGISSQCYIVLDPAWADALRQHNNQQLNVIYHAGNVHDTLIILP
jgi:hypothetical protein